MTTPSPEVRIALEAFTKRELYEHRIHKYDADLTAAIANMPGADYPTYVQLTEEVRQERELRCRTCGPEALAAMKARAVTDKVEDALSATAGIEASTRLIETATELKEDTSASDDD